MTPLKFINERSLYEADIYHKRVARHDEILRRDEFESKNLNIAAMYAQYRVKKLDAELLALQTKLSQLGV